MEQKSNIVVPKRGKEKKEETRRWKHDTAKIDWQDTDKIEARDL